MLLRGERESRFVGVRYARGVFEAVREVSERPALFIQLSFDIGTERTRLNAGYPRASVYFENVVHAAHVDRDYQASLVARGFETSGNIRAPAERNHDGVGGECLLYDCRHLIFRAGIDDEIRDTPHVAAPNPHEIPQAFAVGMNDALERIVHYVVGTHESLQRRALGWRRQ